MSRPIDTERGARIALDTAQPLARQPDLFPTVPPAEYWQAIVYASLHQLEESAALREAVHGR